MYDKQCTLLMSPAEYPIWKPLEGGVPAGCYKHCGEYWINLIDGNTDTPEKGSSDTNDEPTWLGSFTSHCELIDQLITIRLASLNSASINELVGAPTGDEPVDQPVDTSSNSLLTSISDLFNEKLGDTNFIQQYTQPLSASSIKKLSNEFIEFLGGINPYCPNETYNCDDWVIYDGQLTRSKINNNDQHPHNTKVWEQYGSLKEILTRTFTKNDYKLSISYFAACKNSAVCKIPYNKGACVAVQLPVLDANGNPVVDACGETETWDAIFVSLEDKNISSPMNCDDSEKATWAGPYTLCDFFNRPVAYTEEGNTPEHWLRPDAPDNLKCVLSCNSPDGKTIVLDPITKKIRVVVDNKSVVVGTKGLQVGEYGVDKAGNPITYNPASPPCLVTCETMGNGFKFDAAAGKWVVSLARGLYFTATGAIEAFLDTTKGLAFYGNKIGLAIKRGLMFNANGELEANLDKGLTFDANGKIITKNSKPLSHDAAGNNILLIDDKTLEINPAGELTVKQEVIDFAAHYLKNDDNNIKTDWIVGEEIPLNSDHTTSPASVIGNADIIGGRGIYNVTGGYNMTIACSFLSKAAGAHAVISLFHKKAGQADSDAIMFCKFEVGNMITDFEYENTKLRQRNFEKGDIVFAKVTTASDIANFRLSYLHVLDHIIKPNVLAVSKANA